MDRRFKVFEKIKNMKYSYVTYYSKQGVEGAKSPTRGNKCRWKYSVRSVGGIYQQLEL